MAFTMADYFPVDPTVYCGPDSKMICPLCGETSAYHYQPSLFRFDLFVCFSCGFVGDIVSYHATKNKITFEQAFLEYDGSKRELDTASRVLATQGELRAFLMEARKNTLPNLLTVDSILNSRGYLLDVSGNQLLADHVYLVSPEIAMEQKWIPRDIAKRDSVMIPFFLLPGVVSSMYFISHTDSRRYVKFTATRKDGGMHLFSPACRQAFMLSDAMLGLKLADIYTKNFPRDPCPIGLYDPELSFSCWDMYPKLDLTFLITDEIPPILADTRLRSAARLICRSREELSKELGKIGVKGLFESYAEEALPFPHFVCWLAGNKMTNQLQQISKLGLSDQDVERISAMASTRDLSLLEHYLPITLKKRRITQGDQFYYLLDEGGIMRQKRGSNDQRLICDADFRIHYYLRSEEAQYYVGKLRYKGIDIPAKVNTKMLLDGSKLRKWLRETALSQSISPPPAVISEQAAQWFRLCEKFSNAPMVRGHTTAGYHDGKLVYPGLVVEKAGPRTFDLFTTDVALKALKIRQTALYSEAAVEINDEKIIENWAAVLNVLAMLMASLYNIADTTLVFVGSRESAASSALEYFKKRLRVGSDEILPGYPFVPELPTERGMMALDLLDAHIFNLRTPFHGTIFTSPAYRFSEEFINPIRLLCSFGVRSIRKGVFEKSRDCTCGCGYFLNMFLTFIENKRGDPVAVIKKAMERMICGSFIKSGNEEKRRSLAYRFLSLIFLLMSHGRDDLIEASETTMTLKVGRILDAIRDRRKRIGMNKIDPHEIIDSLKLHGGFIEGRPSEIKIEKGFWDEAYSGWIDCCLKFIA